MINERMLELGCKRSTIRELFEYGKELKAKIGDENVFDFSLGNPSVAPPQELNAAIEELIKNEEPIALHGYTSAEGDRNVREKIAANIEKRFGFPCSFSDLYMTAGAAAALSAALSALVTEGEEIVLLAPYFPEYTVFAAMAGAKIKIAACTEDGFQPDIDAISAVINSNTAAIIINSPNNPSGAVYSRKSLSALAELLRKKSTEYGKDIYVISDEPYRELVYGDIEVPFMPSLYDNTLICYSYSKSLSIPGDRIGYVFVSPRANEAYKLMRAIAGAGRSLGYVCAPTLLQRIAAELDGLTSDVKIYEKNRDILTNSLRSYGFTVADADGAFYLFVKSPSGDGREFSDSAKELGLLIVPSEDFGYPGYVRVAYCQTQKMIERSLPKWMDLANIYKVRGII